MRHRVQSGHWLPAASVHPLWGFADRNAHGSGGDKDCHPGFHGDTDTDGHPGARCSNLDSDADAHGDRNTHEHSGPDRFCHSDGYVEFDGDTITIPHAHGDGVPDKDRDTFFPI